MTYEGAYFNFVLFMRVDNEFLSHFFFPHGLYILVFGFIKSNALKSRNKYHYSTYDKDISECKLFFCFKYSIFKVLCTDGKFSLHGILFQNYGFDYKMVEGRQLMIKQTGTSVLFKRLMTCSGESL